MCEYCGCKNVPAIAELTDEHADLIEQSNGLRRTLATGDSVAAFSRLSKLVHHLDVHVRREETGVFRAMRGTGEFADEVDELEAEHRDLESLMAALDPVRFDFRATVQRLLHDLDEHIEREELGIFPVSVVTLGSDGWRIVEQAHATLPSFLSTREAVVTHAGGSALDQRVSEGEGDHPVDVAEHQEPRGPVADGDNEAALALGESIR